MAFYLFDIYLGLDDMRLQPYAKTNKRQLRFESLVAALVTGTNQPLAFVDSPELFNLVHFLEPRVNLPSSHTFRRSIVFHSSLVCDAHSSNA
jgi:hypothetical protein